MIQWLIKVTTDNNYLLEKGSIRRVNEIHEKYIVTDHGLYPTVSPVLFHNEYEIISVS